MRLTVNAPTDIIRIFREHSPDPHLQTALQGAGFGTDFAADVTRSGNMCLCSALRLLSAVGLGLWINDRPVPTKAAAVDALDHIRAEPMQSLSKRAGYARNHFAMAVARQSIRLFTLLVYAEALGAHVYAGGLAPDHGENPPPKATISVPPTRIRDQMIRSPLMDASPNDPPLAGSTPTSLLKTTGCRWPVEGGFCNGGIHSKSYCETHYAKAYRPRLPVHPLITLLATKGPQTPDTFQGASRYNGLVRDRLVMFRRGVSGNSTFYLTDAGRALI